MDTIDTPDLQDDSSAATAKALAHPARMRILRLLARTPGCIGGDIVQVVGLAQSTVSEDLRILKAAGVIVGEIDPPCVRYSLAPQALAPLSALIATLQHTTSGDGCCLPVPDTEGF
ncbi:MAG: winged helix-turn-helix transcriptional regulator [Rhodobacteraceae bacterium]|nr:winged helix-turn-helix transcriptional regulator [Paracoccaceae bacterium]